MSARSSSSFENVPQLSVVRTAGAQDSGSISRNGNFSSGLLALELVHKREKYSPPAAAAYNQNGGCQMGKKVGQAGISLKKLTMINGARMFTLKCPRK
jgi:hypothetical protein